MTPQFHRLRVSSVRPLTPDSLTVAFEVPDDLRKEFMFLPGQHVNLRVWIDGFEYRRSYSIHRAPYEEIVEVAIKRVQGGVVSNWVFENLKEGDGIDVMTPEGEFYIDTSTLKGSILVVAAGSGITPVISMIKQLLKANSKTSVTLLYGNQDMQNIMFSEEIFDLKNQYLSRFIFVPTFSKQMSEVDLFNGRIDKVKISKLQKLVGSLKNMDVAFVCGPFDMIENVTDALISFGLDEASIRFERFGTPRAELSRPVESQQTIQVEGAVIKVTLDGREHIFTFDENSGSILDAGIALGLDLPFSCKSGVCSTCKAVRLVGEVSMANNYALTKLDLQKGLILTCQSLPATRTVAISYDVRQHLLRPEDGTS